MLNAVGFWCDVAFYSPEGLRQIALLLEQQLSPNAELAQNELARRSGVSSGTIGNLRGHRHNHGDTMVGRKPDPDTLLTLAPHLQDPLTEQPFDPERLLAIARGQMDLYPRRRLMDADRDDSTASYPEAIKFLKSKMEGRSEEEFANFCRIAPQDLREILRGRRPTLIELLKFGVLFVDRNPIPLARLYGVNEDTLIGNSDRRRSKQSS